MFAGANCWDLVHSNFEHNSAIIRDNIAHQKKVWRDDWIPRLSLLIGLQKQEALQPFSTTLFGGTLHSEPWLTFQLKLPAPPGHNSSEGPSYPKRDVPFHEDKEAPRALVGDSRINIVLYRRSLLHPVNQLRAYIASLVGALSHVFLWCMICPRCKQKYVSPKHHGLKGYGLFFQRIAHKCEQIMLQILGFRPKVPAWRELKFAEELLAAYNTDWKPHITEEEIREVGLDYKEVDALV